MRVGGFFFNVDWSTMLTLDYASYGKLKKKSSKIYLHRVENKTDNTFIIKIKYF